MTTYSGLTATDQSFPISLPSAVSWSYEHCLSLQQLQIDDSFSNRKYSYDVDYDGRTSTTLTLRLSSALPASVKAAVVRYLIIKDDYISQDFMKVVYCRAWFSSPQQIKTGDSYSHTHSGSVPDIPSTYEKYHFLVALDIQPISSDYFNFQVSSYKPASNQYQIDITSDSSNSVYLNLISFYILAYDRSQLAQQKQYEFYAGIISNI